MAGEEEFSVYSEDVWDDAAKVKIGTNLQHIPVDQIYRQMAIDYLSPSSKRKNEYVAFVRGWIEYNHSAGITYPAKTKKLLGSKNKVDYASILSNTDPFYSPLEDSQRILNSGAIKDFDKKKILLLEIPLFFSPSVDMLGKNTWLNCLSRMDITNVKNKRDFVSGEIIYVAFANPQNFSGAKFLRRPIEGRNVVPKYAQDGTGK